MADAMRGGRAGLRRIFADIPALTEASVPDLATRAARGAVKDLLLGKRLDAAKDAALLIGRARATYGAYRETRIPQLEAIQHDPTAKAIPERMASAAGSSHRTCAPCSRPLGAGSGWPRIAGPG